MDWTHRLFSAYRCRDSHTAPAFDDSRLFDAEMARDMRCVGEMAINTGLARLFLAATQLELCLVRIRLLGAANPLVEDRVLNIDRAGEIAGGRGSKHCRGDRLGEGRMSGQRVRRRLVVSGESTTGSRRCACTPEGNFPDKSTEVSSSLSASTEVFPAYAGAYFRFPLFSEAIQAV